MKKVVWMLMALMLVCAMPAVAQNNKQEKHKGKNWHKEFVEFKVKYMSDAIDLRDDQKQKFTDIYTKMEQEKGAAFHAARAAEKAVRNNEKATDAQYEAAANAMSEYKAKELDIDKKYTNQLKSVLTSKQMYELKKAERKFQDKLVKMREQKEKERKSKK